MNLLNETDKKVTRDPGSSFLCDNQNIPVNDTMVKEVDMLGLWLMIERSGVFERSNKMDGINIMYVNDYYRYFFSRDGVLFQYQRNQ
ncbi:hypothetical protein HFA01_05020 [Halobacillus faecis]|uniref:Uncharacterized protein n=1 Tax=Halobacillus faecis TaxID=360184 RepID=A0A511WM83_9BACI|nr:hypothetical protein HFA01_05020 [Halobacillus faecis]